MLCQYQKTRYASEISPSQGTQPHPSPRCHSTSQTHLPPPPALAPARCSSRELPSRSPYPAASSALNCPMPLPQLLRRLRPRLAVRLSCEPTRGDSGACCREALCASRRLLPSCETHMPPPAAAGEPPSPSAWRWALGPLGRCGRYAMHCAMYPPDAPYPDAAYPDAPYRDAPGTPCVSNPTLVWQVLVGADSGPADDI